MRSSLATASITATLALAATFAAPTAATASNAEPAAAAPAKHVVAFKVAHCEACRMTVGHADRTYSDTWVSQSKNVVDGKVEFSVPAQYADTLSATVIAPWEGPLGYVTQVVFRYTGHDTGDRVTVADAQQQDRGSLCLKGDATAAHVTVPLTIKKVEVAGQTPTGRTDGTLAFATRTQAFAKPVTHVLDGVAGGQEFPYCD